MAKLTKIHKERHPITNRIKKCIKTIQSDNASKEPCIKPDSNNLTPNPIDPRDVITNPWTSESTWYPKSKLLELCIKALEYVKTNERCITMGAVYIAMDINPEKWIDWSERYDFFREMHEQCLRIIALRRETGMAFREMSERSTMYMMHNYDKDWDNSNRYWAEFRKNEQLQLAKGSFTIEMTEAPRTDVVPERKVELLEDK
jgi:hypothetical protein